ncbi:hypothetical protein RSOLAG1IB_06147 [Rhizoctonia solani AG-1 IB]|uniref:Uncharacterized protein n=1 Tax=Thanatephorus cucumeris (strain AG1-IB / isolate 7/3/14) TaxID=1108050 RepID=A0A0B7F8H1_THACB|nr:hypothetical protein RSOLAG1IB_06147 [Rhizoctonia solani AG-1 IB]
MPTSQPLQVLYDFGIFLNQPPDLFANPCSQVLALVIAIALSFHRPAATSWAPLCLSDARELCACICTDTVPRARTSVWQVVAWRLRVATRPRCAHARILMLGFLFPYSVSTFFRTFRKLQVSLTPLLYCIDLFLATRVKCFL